MRARSRRRGEDGRRIRGAAERVRGQREVVGAIHRRRLHRRAQAEAVGERGLQAQAGVLAYDVGFDVVEPPIGARERPLALGDGVTELVKDELPEGVVVVERVVSADRDHAAPVAGRIRVARPLDAEADRRRCATPDLVDGLDGEGASGGEHRRHLTRSPERLVVVLLLALRYRAPE